MDGQYGPEQAFLKAFTFPRIERANVAQRVPCMWCPALDSGQSHVPRRQGTLLLRYGDHPIAKVFAKPGQRYGHLCNYSCHIECLRNHVRACDATHESHRRSTSPDQGVWLECEKHGDRSSMFLVERRHGTAKLSSLQLETGMGARPVGRGHGLPT